LIFLFSPFLFFSERDGEREKERKDNERERENRFLLWRDPSAPVHAQD
jgi:hypothetical protein